MKKILFTTLVLVVALCGQASHFAGGRIWYEYAGDAQNPYRYNVFLIINRDVTGQTMNNQWPGIVCISSSCFSTMTVLADSIILSPGSGSDTIAGSMHGSIVTPGQTDCIDPLSSGLALTESYFSKVQVTLPGKCSDFKFSYNGNARNPSTNIVSTVNFYIETNLNNLYGPNTSPKFVNQPVKGFCIGQPVEWPQCAIEPDGDSVHYEFTKPYTASCSNTFLPNVSYQPGYSLISPLFTANGLNLNKQTGVMTFTPAQPEVAVINITATEYRKNASTQQYYIVGSSLVDIQASIVTSCQMQNGQWLSDRMDTTGNISLVSCGDTLIHIKTMKSFFPSSLAPDGSDFALLNSKGKLVPVIAAGTLSSGSCRPESKSFWLKLQYPISYNDKLTLTSRLGNDLNTLTNTCGNSLIEGDSIMIAVSNCITSIGHMESLTDKNISTYPNPVTNSLRVHTPKATGVTYISVYDLHGKVVIQKIVTTDVFELSTEFLPSGIYLLRCNANEWSVLSKFEKL